MENVMLVKKPKDNTFEFYEEITAIRTIILNVVLHLTKDNKYE